ncbi:unnamed protein product [Pedinophyceae sp. YPF-701]|nr:unnamed protein product [Pedinophyceae sp. YPF-701]
MPMGDIFRARREAQEQRRERLNRVFGDRPRTASASEPAAAVAGTSPSPGKSTTAQIYAFRSPGGLAAPVSPAARAHAALSRPSTAVPLSPGARRVGFHAARTRGVSFDSTGTAPSRASDTGNSATTDEQRPSTANPLAAALARHRRKSSAGAEQAADALSGPLETAKSTPLSGITSGVAPPAGAPNPIFRASTEEWNARRPRTAAAAVVRSVAASQASAADSDDGPLFGPPLGGGVKNVHDATPRTPAAERGSGKDSDGTEPGSPPRDQADASGTAAPEVVASTGTTFTLQGPRRRRKTRPAEALPAKLTPEVPDPTRVPNARPATVQEMLVRSQALAQAVTGAVEGGRARRKSAVVYGNTALSEREAALADEGAMRPTLPDGARRASAALGAAGVVVPGLDDGLPKEARKGRRKTLAGIGDGAAKNVIGMLHEKRYTDIETAAHRRRMSTAGVLGAARPATSAGARTSGDAKDKRPGTAGAEATRGSTTGVEVKFGNAGETFNVKGAYFMMKSRHRVYLADLRGLVDCWKEATMRFGLSGNVLRADLVKLATSTGPSSFGMTEYNPMQVMVRNLWQYGGSNHTTVGLRDMIEAAYPFATKEETLELMNETRGASSVPQGMSPLEHHAMKQLFGVLDRQGTGFLTPTIIENFVLAVKGLDQVNQPLLRTRLETLNARYGQGGLLGIEGLMEWWRDVNALDANPISINTIQELIKPGSSAMRTVLQRMDVFAAGSPEDQAARQAARAKAKKFAQQRLDRRIREMQNPTYLT